MAKLKVGDIVTARAAGLYAYTTNKRKAKILSIGGHQMQVELLGGTNRGPWYVTVDNFVKVAKKPAQTIGQFVKAVVVDNSDYEKDFKLGQVVILDTKSFEKAESAEDEDMIQVVGSTWGSNITSRFAIDPLIKVKKEELIHG